MKKKIGITILILMIFLTSMISALIYAQGNNNPNKILGSPEYVLNILGKKDDWSPNGEFNNPDRHTIFVPEGSSQIAADVTIWITQAPRKSEEPFCVLDGYGFDENGAALQLGDGYFAVYVVALGKPVEETSSLSGCVKDPNSGAALLFLGGANSHELKPHGKQPVWGDYSKLLYITETQMSEYFKSMGFSDTRADELAHAVIEFFNSRGLVKPDVDDDPLNGETPGIWIFDFFDYLVEILPGLLQLGDPDVSGILDGE